MALVNNGQFRKQQKDVNPNSPTFNTLRWIDGEGQRIDCPIPTPTGFRSEEISELVYRNDCGSGYYGGSVIYTLPEGHAVQNGVAEANTLARAYYDSTKQAYANEHAECFVDDDVVPVEDCPPLGEQMYCEMNGQTQPAQIEYYTLNGKKCARWSCDNVLWDNTGGGSGQPVQN